MVDITNQRRIAAKLLKCGVNRVWIDPTGIEDVSEAITRSDINSLINSGVIRARQKKGISRGRIQKIRLQKSKGKRKGQGSRKGGKYARFPRKRRWIQTIRPLRETLKKFRDTGKINRRTYRKYYLRAKGGMYKSKAHLESQMKAENVFITDKKGQ